MAAQKSSAKLKLAGIYANEAMTETSAPTRDAPDYPATAACSPSPIKKVRTPRTVKSHIDLRPVDQRSPYSADFKKVYLHEVKLSERANFRLLAKAYGWQTSVMPDDVSRDRDYIALTSSPENPCFLVPRTFNLALDADYPENDSLLDFCRERVNSRSLARYFIPWSQPDTDDRYLNLFGYGLAIPALCFQSRDGMIALENSRNHDYVTSSHRRLTYFCGVLIEGIHFNLDNPHVVAQANAVFRDLSFLASDVQAAVSELPQGSIQEMLTDSTNRHARLSNVHALRCADTPALANGVPFRHGYIVIDNRIVVTTAPSLESFVTAHERTHRIVSVPQLADGDVLDVFADRWAQRVTSTLKDTYDHLTLRIEEKMAEVLTLTGERATAQRILSLANDDTAKTLHVSLERIRNAGEIESVTCDGDTLIIVSKDMLGYNDNSGDERYCGQMEIQIHLSSAVRVRNIAAPHKDYRNPHGGCVGSFSRIFESALAMSDYHQLVISSMEYYRFFDKGHTHKWDLLPKSKERPEKTYESDWQVLVGDWPDSAVFKGKARKKRGGSSIATAFTSALYSFEGKLRDDYESGRSADTYDEY
jgi:hypothetical protein